MKKLSLVYATKTNHSKKIAQAVSDVLNVRANNIKDNPVLDETDILFLIGGIYGGESLPGFIEYVKKIDKEKVKSVALITSCTSKKQSQKTIRKILEDKGIPVVDEFICSGSFLILKMNHPNDKDIQAAIQFAAGVVQGK